MGCMTDHIKRVSAGVPAGGQFAEQNRPESDVALGGAARVTTFDVPLTYTDKQLPSPRHRIPRDVQHSIVEQVFVNTYTDDEAPIALVTPGELGRREVEYRNADGALWTKVFYGDVPVAADNLDLVLKNFRFMPHNYNDALSVQLAAHDAAADFAVIDGDLWQRAAEPGYYTATFGLGHNHGGTGLMIGRADEGRVDPDDFFYADEVDEAIEHAVKAAEKRGDTESIEHIRNIERIKTAGSYTLATPRPPRLDLPWTYNASPAELVEARKKIESELAKIDGAITDVVMDGQRVKQIDFGKLNDGQAARVKRFLERRAELGLL